MPSLYARIVIGTGAILFGSGLTNIWWRATGDVQIVFYLLAVVVATWLAGPLTGAVVAIAESVAQFNWKLRSGADWAITDSNSWMRLAVFACAAFVFIWLWEMLERRRRELASTIHELDNANSVKDEFLGLVSHELKTPITVIRGNAEVLDREQSRIDAENRAAAIHDIRTESERLARIVDDLLVVSRLGLVQLEREPLLLQRIAERVVNEHQRYQAGRPMRVNGDAPPAIGTPAAVEQILNNLLVNAEKYSPKDAPIDIDVGADGREVEVCVRDRGVGIAPDELERVFTPFFRADSVSRSTGGMGIGLTVCKRLVEAQGGRIWARRPPAGGSEVWFTLPRAREDAFATA
ncbi:MAG TPA: HAMP domain-containing sensor histidine kinase [Dehalococcoidia bacterium]